MMDAVLTLIGEDLRKVELQFRKDLQSDVPLIRKVGEYVFSSGGKRIRPALLLISAKLCGYEGERHVPLASVVEFIHTATLLHDDVVDNANLRRGLASANTLWGNEASVLVGDFLFSKSFSLMVDDGDLSILRILSHATTMIAEGEVLQLVTTSDIETTQQRYIQVVKCKTAILLSAACQAGAILGKVSPEQEDALRDFGMNIGIAFQLMDDILDYVSSEAQFGKPIGHDLEEGKITLPLIHALKSCTPEEIAFVGNVVTEEVPDKESLAGVFDIVSKYGGIEYTVATAKTYIDKAKEHLDLFPDSPVKDSLLHLADYIVSRER